MIVTTQAAATTFAIFGMSALLFISNRLRCDLIGVLVILALSLSGVLTPEEASAGFSNPVLIILVCMFIVGEAVADTGIARKSAEKMIEASRGNEAWLTALLMTAAGLVGSFMNSTATVAIFIPLTVAVCRRTGLNRKRLLIPIACASLISGMMTMVASTQNLISTQLLTTHGLEPMDFFEFTPFGLCVLGAAVVYMILFGRNMLGEKESGVASSEITRTQDLLTKYDLDDKIRRCRIEPGSSLAGQAVSRARLRENYGIDLLAVEKPSLHGSNFMKPSMEYVFQPNDILFLAGEVESLDAAARKKHLTVCRRLHEGVRQAMLQEIGAAEILIGPDSTLIGQTLKDVRFGSRYHVTVLSIRRSGKAAHRLEPGHRLRFGDTLLVGGAWPDILNLMEERVNFVLLTMPHESCELSPTRHKAPVAAAILALMAGSMAFHLLPAVLAAITAALALMLTGCVDIKTVYKRISWQTIILIGGMLPLATAMDKSGASDALSIYWTGLVGGWPPAVVLAAIFFLTAFFGLFLPAAATAVLVIPIAVESAPVLGMPSHALVMTVAIACACPFVSPYSSPANLMAMEAGGYELKDFVKTGIPLLATAAVITVSLVCGLYL